MSPGLDELVAHCLGKEPAGRFQAGRVFLPEVTMAQRISRAKQRIKTSGVPFLAGEILPLLGGAGEPPAERTPK